MTDKPTYNPAALPALVEALQTCADELEKQIKAAYKYGELQCHPSVAPLLTFDLIPVSRAHAALALTEAPVEFAPPTEESDVERKEGWYWVKLEDQILPMLYQPAVQGYWNTRDGWLLGHLARERGLLIGPRIPEPLVQEGGE